MQAHCVAHPLTSNIVILLILLALFFVLLSSSSATPLAKRSKETPDAIMENPASRVINGDPVTDKTEYPFLVDLSFHQTAISSSRFCTATLIAPDIVLTAAHCVLNHGYSSPVYATVGRIRLEDNHADNNNSQTFRTVASIVHPEYRGLGSPNDVALMLLNASSEAPTVHLADRTPRKDDVAWVVGYGIQMLGTVERSSRPIEVLSARLQKTALRIKDRDFCSNVEMDIQTAPGMLCTAGVKQGSSACRGDSGGGLFSRGKRRTTSSVDHVMQIGIVSYGDAHCSSKDSGVFTEVSSVKEWIESSVKRLHRLFSSVRIPLTSKTTEQINSRGIANGTGNRLVRHLESDIKYYNDYSSSAEDDSMTNGASSMTRQT